MRLKQQDAEDFISLISKLDFFTLDLTNVLKKRKNQNITDPNAIRILAREQWMKRPQIIEQFISHYNEKLNPEEVRTLKSWKEKQRSEYWFLYEFPEFGAFYSPSERKFYGALALTEPFSDIIPYQPPVVLETALLPYKNKIVWDGLTLLEKKEDADFSKDLALLICQKMLMENVINEIVLQF